MLDAIDGIVPGTIVEPQTTEGVAATLAWASRQRLSVVIRGGGTKTRWGWIPARIDVLLSVRALNRIVSHRHGDLTVTVEAGASLHDLNQALSVHGQWLPLDPPFADRATIGGLLATNDSGPRRHRFGTPRDLVIGVQLATTDGRLCKSGGQVVKNVAGYDLSKLISGSFGQLAAIVSATFKLSPLPAASGTLVIERLDPGSLSLVVNAVLASQLEPSAFEIHAWHAPSGGEKKTTSLIRFESLRDVVDAEIAAARARIGAVHSAIDVVTGEAEQGVWRQHTSSVWQGPGAVVRASWLPADLPEIIALMPQISGGCTVEMIGRVGIGAGLIRVDGPPAHQAEMIVRLRAEPRLDNVVVVRAGTELKTKVDVWGTVPNRVLTESIRSALDPHGTLGAGRGPL